MTVGERIKQKRIERGMSADELADKLGKNRATVYRYESNEIENLPIAILEPIAKALNTTPMFLMGWDEEKIASIEREAKERADREDAIEEDLRQKLIRMDSEKLEVLNEILTFEPTTEELNQILEYTQFIIGRRR